MGKTLREVQAADVANVFYRKDADGNHVGVSETVTFYVGGDPDRGVEVDAIVDAGHLEGSREARGDGVIPFRQHGHSERESITVQFRKSQVTPTRPQGEDPQFIPDTLEWNGVMWAAQRVTGEDAQMIDILFARRVDNFGRQARLN